MKYPRSLPDTKEAKAWWDGAYEFFKEKGTKVGYPPLEIDGEVIQLHYSSNQASVNTEKGTGLKLRKVAQQKKDAKVRKESLQQQTLGDTKLADTPTPKGFNDHHMRPRGVIQQFFEGLNETDSKELARYAEQDLLMPVGDHPANNARIPDTVHDQHHAYARANPGLERGFDMDKFKGYTLDQRKAALKLYKEQIQPALDEDLFSRMQKLNLETKNGSIRLNRKAMTALAAGGIAALGPLGTAASAAEVKGRTEIAGETGNIVDQAQAGIAGVSLAGDVASYNPITAIPGALISTGADALNVVIDGGRAMLQGTATYDRKQLERKEQLRAKPADAPERENALSAGFAGGM